jgi:hypothetical protein
MIQIFINNINFRIFNQIKLDLNLVLIFHFLI